MKVTASFHILLRGIAYYLPYLEIVAGAALLLPGFSRAGAWLLAALMVLFIAAILQAWLRGLNIDCGCFGQVVSGGTNYAWMIARDLVLLGALGIIGLSQNDRLGIDRMRDWHT